MNREPGWEERMHGDPSGWPEAFKALSTEAEPAPGLIEKAMANADLPRDVARFPSAWRRPALRLTAAAVLAGAVSWAVFHALPSSAPPRWVVPAAVILRAGQELTPRATDPILPGDGLVVRAESARLKLDDGDLLIEGPALVLFHEEGLGRVFEVRYGAITIASDHGNHPLVWVASGARYTMTGTSARLSVAPGSQRLLVWSGSFEITLPGQAAAPVSVRAGESATRGSGGMPLRIARLTPSEIRLGTEIESLLSDLSSGKPGQRDSADAPDSSTGRDRADMGFAPGDPPAEVILHSGEHITGKILSDGDVYRIKTQNGVRSVPREAIRMIQETAR